MKYIIILGDGMADHPIAKLNGKTPLMAAQVENMDKLARIGKTGMFQTVPLDMPPGSEVANLAVLGYNVHKVYEGRGVLEGASMGVNIEEGDLAMRCNLLCIEDGKIKNHSAGHISTEESHVLIDFLNEKLATDKIRFYPGISFRHLLVVKGGNNDLKFTPPHDVPGTAFKDVMIEAISNEGEKTAKLLNDLILRSQEILKDHPINKQRITEGKDPANSVWFWSSGYKPEMKTLKDKYNVSGAVISAVDIIKGLGVFAGMDVIEVEGATGLTDTNYEGKAEAAVRALKDHDLVYLHVEATDEAGHAGDVDLKILALEFLDKRVVKYVLEETEKMNEPVSLALLPDHATPCEVRTHTHDAIPFVIYNPEIKPDDVTEYNEESCKNGGFGTIKEDEFIRILLGKI
ncbi:MAG: cofactor-independent phosphoglycerate mutase [Candidatus Cloacimonetes bacterium]|nr:cofactor-independent phosphoglycerate mutase [Candidatus Cloacimonadota bacterium]MCF7813741.1 cofactor-independent phosphoglycerate mutase [Candidatus Cloacimonadota bacterium]MCF7867807.1 cofactor-independent phosphoglycerate mutase [Candidatus Cloacimonadota bacterium]MCF7883215.1 cofactor-independent phosphoglycerate mutase [Candidatus Cloacimonadota bacterium]